jgi:hypothetical protein
MDVDEGCIAAILVRTKSFWQPKKNCLKAG